MSERRRDADLLRRIVRLAASATTPDDFLNSLVAAAVDDLGADAAAVLRVESDGKLTLAFERGLPPALHGWRPRGDVLDSDVGAELIAACSSEFARAVTLPLVSGGGLFGAFVLLVRGSDAEIERRMPHTVALVDLAALMLGQLSAYTELKKSYDELRSSRLALQRSEKLSALGQMASGVAHDLKNILNPLGLQLSLLKRRFSEPDEKLNEAFAQMKLALDRGDQTINLLRNFAGQTPRAADATVDLDQIAHEAFRLCLARASTRSPPVALREMLGGAPSVPGDSVDILNALMNLIVNAIDALSEGGNVTVRTGPAGAGGAFVEVADDGPGMPPEIEAHVFEPFFTTKGEQGSGLGLAMLYATVQRHAGEIQLQTAVGKGTTFTITLPGSGATA